MKKDKSGFTLIELIIVIALLALLTMIALPNIVKVKNKSLKNTLKSKIILIENAAKEYGNDNLVSIPSNITNTTESSINSCVNNPSNTTSCSNDCLIVVVRTLLEQGYLNGDSADKNSIINPLNNKSLNNELVCIRFDSTNAMQRKMIAYVIGKNKWFNDED